MRFSFLLCESSRRAAHSRLFPNRLPLRAGDPPGERRDRPAEARSAHLCQRGEEEAAELHHSPGDPQSDAQRDTVLLPER